MRYDEEGVAWKEELETEMQTLSSYHCGYMSCTVRYAPSEGYFTVVDAPSIPHFVEEPEVNLYTCLRHGTWLYQSRAEGDIRKLVWRCGTVWLTIRIARPSTNLLNANSSHRPNVSWRLSPSDYPPIRIRSVLQTSGRPCFRGFFRQWQLRTRRVCNI
jgi:hypothetical protein